MSTMEKTINGTTDFFPVLLVKETPCLWACNNSVVLESTGQSRKVGSFVCPGTVRCESVISGLHSLRKNLGDNTKHCSAGSATVSMCFDCLERITK